MKKIIECVPNFSEGRDMGIIKQITDAIESVSEISLLDVDPGKATNRTVVTFVGEPEHVIEAALRGVKKAAELIDMSKHSGAHPRFGATDVCPLVPVANISMEETVEHAHKLAQRIGEEAGVPVYCYENAAQIEERKNLAVCRAGEYEAVKERIGTERWKPDFGPAEFTVKVAKSGVTAVGARNFLVAYNFNLNTTSTRRANAIAFDVRERGRTKREGDSVTGKIIKDENGKPVMIPGTLKATKAIGWFIEEYGVAQISMNMTDITITSIHQAFDEVCAKAQTRGIRVTGSELVGVVPLKAMIDAGKHYLRMQSRSTGIPDREIIKIAVKSLGLDELYPFDPDKKIIEYILENSAKKDQNKLVDMKLTKFVEEAASESPAPGGGSVAAYVGALGVSLATMVANLSAHKVGWDHRWEEFSDWAEKGKQYHTAMLNCVDEDTNAFNQIMAAYSLPKKTEQEKVEFEKAKYDATVNAIKVPLQVMQLAYDSLEVMQVMAEIGNPNCISDAGVGALCARTAVEGAYLNVKINVVDFDDKIFVDKALATAEALLSSAKEKEANILNTVLKVIEG